MGACISSSMTVEVCSCSQKVYIDIFCSGSRSSRKDKEVREGAAGQCIGPVARKETFVVGCRRKW